MIRVLLADDSPHAQRMGERILREEGFEVVTVTDGQTAMMRLADVDPDLVLADVSLPRRSGYDICREIKNHPRFQHVRVVLTAGLLERFDEAESVAVGCDAILKKPFEPSAMLETIRPLIDSARLERAEIGELPPLDLDASSPEVPQAPVALSNESVVAPRLPDPEIERVKAAVTLALDAASPSLIEEITRHVLIALRR
ncbi:MAG: response regulator [Bryobacteraceae bacterium]|nr:response regulator [Bryobacteraceae bacterium]